jgi:hypothetical protein
VHVLSCADDYVVQVYGLWVDLACCFELWWLRAYCMGLLVLQAILPASWVELGEAV